MLSKWRNHTPHLFKWLFLFIVLLWVAKPSHSLANSSLKIQNITHINKLSQDNKGFIWLAGQHGLTRYDSENSIHFSFNNNTHPLPFNWINDFTQIDDKLILATETNGLYQLDIKTGQNSPLLTNIDIDNVLDVTFFNDRFYFKAHEGLFSYNPENKNIQLITNDLTIIDITHTQSKLYITSPSGLFTLKNNQISKILNQPIKASVAVNDVMVTVTDNRIITINDDGSRQSILVKESLYQATKAFNEDCFFTLSHNGKIDKYNTANLAKNLHGYKRQRSSYVRAILHDSSGVLWLATNQGVEQLYENTIIDHPKTFDIETNANEIALFNNEIIIGSYGAGLQNLFHNAFNKKSNNNLTDSALKVTSLVVIQDELYLGTFDGVWKYDKKSNQLNRLSLANNDKLILRLKNRDNILYIGTDGDGLYIYDLTQKKVISHIKSENGLSNDEIIDVLPLEHGSVWIATAKGIDIYNLNTRQIENINIPNDNKVVAMAFADKKVFAATLGNGIFAFNQYGQLLTHIGKGLNFSGLLVHEDHIWAAARPGIYRLSIKNHQLSMLENTGGYSFVGSSLVKNNIFYSSYYGGVLEIPLAKRPVFHPKVLISKTTVSGKSYLLNNTIEVNSSNDLITLDLASLDFRPGQDKEYQYKINNTEWQPISGSQLTLTGLASGEYNIEIMATNSLGQWSDNKAYTEIHVAYPWYWTTQAKIIYMILIVFITVLTAWLLYLRTRSINHIHNLLKDDMRNYGRLMKTTERNLQLTLNALTTNDIDTSRVLVEKTLEALQSASRAQEPDNLSGSDLTVAIPFLANYIATKYDAKLQFTLDDKVDTLNYEMKADIYKVIFEAIMSSIFKSTSCKFNLNLQEVKGKIWLTITSDSTSFSQLNSKVNFDLASYTIRQIIQRYHAPLNTFDNDDGSSQLVISFPLMQLS